MKKLYFLISLFLFWNCAPPVYAQYVRQSCSTVTPAATERSTCYDYQQIRWKYWSGTGWVDVPVGSGGGGGSVGCNTSGVAILKGDNAGGCSNATPTIDYTPVGSITTSGLTQTTGTLLGRTSLPNPGTVQQITVGAGLTLNAGSLIVGNAQITAAMLAGSIPYTKLIGTDIVTVGTVSTGTWQATPIASAYIASTGATIGTYGDATHVPRVTVNAAGQITSVSSVAITGGGSGGGVPGGSPGQMQVNIAGAFAGTTGATATATVVTLVNPVVSGCIKDLSNVCVITLDGTSGVTVGTGTNLFRFDTSAITALRDVLIPNSNSITVSRTGIAAVTNQFVTGISATTGVISRAQPAFADLAGNISISQMNSASGASNATFWRGDNTWAVPPGGGGGGVSPGGSDTQIQYNVGGTGLGGISGCTSNGTALTCTSTNLIANRPKISVGIADSANNLVIIMPGDGTVQLGTGANSLSFDTSGFTAARTAVVQDSDGIVAYLSGTPANNDCAKFNVSGGIYKLVTAGGSCSTGGTVTSVAATVTGGIIAVAGTPVTTTGTLAFTVAGTSGGIPYFSDATHWASSAALTAHGVVIGGGAGTAPTSTAAGTTGYVLTSNGASADPTFQAPTGGSATPCTTTALSLQYNSAGSLGCVSAVTSNGTYLTATTGGLRIADLKDANGAYSLVLAATASAVDGITITNAATANPATVTASATGSDTNINLKLLAKGSGIVQVGADCASGSSGVQCAGVGQFGIIKQDGIDTGTISFLTQSAGGTYNWNWPTTAGTAGQVLTSQGGVSSAMTWTTFTSVSKIANGTKGLNTSAIASGTCSTEQTDTATGVATTDAVTSSVNGDPTATTGYAPSTSGGLHIWVYPKSNAIGFRVCNNTSASITPSGTVSINYIVTR